MSEFIQGFQTTEGEKKYDYNALGNLPDLTISKDDITGALGFVPPSKAEVEASVKVASDAAATADNKAVAAQNTANQAVGAAQQAQSTAEGAMLAAQNAQNRADDAHERIDDSYSQIVQGSIITIDNCDNAPLQNLRIFGKTIQNGTPAPEAPVPLDSVGDDGSVTATVCGKNLLENTATTVTRNGVTFTVNADGSITVNGTANGNAEININTTFKTVGAYIMSGADNTAKLVLRIGKANNATQYITNDGNEKTIIFDGTEMSVRFYIQVASGVVANTTIYPMLRLASYTDDTYEPYNGQTLSLSTPNGLPGIPVSSGGNYTDENGQQWICDEVDFEKGKYVQRVYSHVLDGSVQPTLNTGSKVDTNGGKRFALKLPKLPACIDQTSIANALCSHIAQIMSQGSSYHHTGSESVYSIGDTEGYVSFRMKGINTVEDMTSFLTQSPVTVLYELAFPIYHDLTAEELAAYAALHTNYPNTTIYNDGGADMEVQYATPSTVLSLSGGRMNGSIDMVNHQLTGLPTPKNNTDAVSLEYLQETKLELAQGINDVSDIAYGAQETADEALEKADDAHKRIDDSQVQVIKGEIVSVENSADAPLQGLRIFGKTTQNGTPAPETPVSLESVGNAGSITVCIGTSDMDESPQTLTISSPNGLPGIPVSSGGNYTDENGQQWACDEVDFARGVYIQNVQKVILDGMESWRTYGTFGYYFEFADIESIDSPMGVSDGSKSEQRLMCSHFAVQPKYVNIADRKHGMIVIYCSYSTGKCRISFDLEGTTMATYAAEQYAAGNPVTVLYQRAVPIETALSAEELAQYATLHTNYPNTTVFNDGGAGVEVQYATPTTALPLTGGRYKVATPYAPTDAVPKSYADRIDKKVDTLREVVSSFHSNIVQEASGEVIQVNGSAEAPLIGLKVFGKTEQVTTTGKNLIDITKAVTDRCSMELKSDNEIRVYSDDTAGTYKGALIKQFVMRAGQSYTLSVDVKSVARNAGIALRKVADNMIIGTGAWCNVAKTLSLTRTVDADTEVFVSLFVCGAEAGSGDNTFANVQVELGSTATAYEPYTGGKPSPSPDYPQPLESVGDDGNVEVLVAGNNLLNFPDVEPYLNNGITWSCKDGVVHAKGASTAISYSSDYINMNIAGLVGTFYKSSPVNGCSLMCQVVKNGETTWLPNPITLDGSESSVLLYYQCPVGTTVDSDLYPMLSISEEDLQWEPYKEVQTLPFSTPNGLPGIPVPSGGNYTDSTGQQWICDEVDFEKGVFVQRIGKMVFDGNTILDPYVSTNWKTCAIVYKRTTGGNAQKPGGNVLCDSLETVIGQNNLFSREGIASNASATGYTYIGLSFERLGIAQTTDATAVVNAMKAYLGSHPMTVIYELVTPIETALSAEQLAAFAALHTNYPNTTVFNEEGAGMEVKYVADTKMYVDKKFEELAKILVNKL